MLNFRGVFFFCVCFVCFLFWLVNPPKSLKHIAKNRMNMTWKHIPFERQLLRLGKPGSCLEVKPYQQLKSICINYQFVGNLYGGFLKWWYPTTMGFPTKTDHFGVFWGYHHLRKHPYANRKPKQNSVALMPTYVLVSLKLFDNKIPQ